MVNMTLNSSIKFIHASHGKTDMTQVINAIVMQVDNDFAFPFFTKSFIRMHIQRNKNKNKPSHHHHMCAASQQQHIIAQATNIKTNKIQVSSEVTVAQVDDDLHISRLTWMRPNQAAIVCVLLQVSNNSCSPKWTQRYIVTVHTKHTSCQQLMLLPQIDHHQKDQANLVSIVTCRPVLVCSTLTSSFSRYLGFQPFL